MLLVQTLRDRVNGRNDEGQALVLVIGMVIVMAGVLTVVASTTVFGSFFTTQSRASVESQAAADAGIDVAYASMVSDVAACTAVNGHFVSGAVPAYDVQVSYQQVKDGAWTDGCPDLINEANWPEQVRVVSTGTAKRQGTGGFEAGDNSTVEALWTKPVDPPSFDHAVRADTFVGTGAIQDIDADGTPATIFTKGNLDCDAGISVPGHMMVQGDVMWSNSNCTVDGDVYVGGDLYFPASSPSSGYTVGGNLTVYGNISASNKAPKDVGDFIAASNYKSKNIPKVAGDVTVGGYIDTYCSYDNVEEVPASAFSLYSKKDNAPCSASHSDFDKPTKTTMQNPSVPSAAEYGIFDIDFPPLRPTLETFESYAQRSWNDPEFTTNELYGTECRTNNDPGTITIDENTVIDTTSQCPDGIHMGFGGKVTIELNADLVIFGTSIKKDLDLTIRSGDGEKHSIYLATPMPEDFAGCPAADPDEFDPDSGIPVGIQFVSGPLSMDSNVALLSYTTETFLFSNGGGEGYAGQVYACQSNWQSNFPMTFRKVGDDDSTPSFADYTTQYIRQG